MYKVIIVDDEILVRKRLIFGFDWNKIGYEIIDEVDNGYDALRLMQEKAYDLAVIDIAMPGMNGIELTKEVREKNIPVNLIFLTGHSEFKYAQEAVHYGVYYYILKPINEAEFVLTLEKLAVRMEEDNSRKLMQHSAVAVMEAKLFSDLFHDSPSGEEIDESRTLLAKHGISEDSSYYVALFRAEQFQKENAAIIQKVQTVSEACEKYLKESGKCIVINDIYRDYMIVLVKTEDYITDAALSGQLEAVRRFLKEASNSGVRCGVSKRNRGFSGLKKAYVEAVSALNNAKVLGKSSLTYQWVEARGESHYKIPEQKIKELHQQIGRKDFEACKAVIHEIFTDMFDREVSFECITMNVNRLFLTLLDMGVISELEMKKIISGGYDYEEVFDNMADVEEFTEWFEHIIYTLMENTIRTSTESLPVIERTCRYIREHYDAADLNQARIADIMAVTQSYISGVFKKVMGVTMVQYITMVRMEKARELLLASELEIREVSEKVGYNDEYYFSKCFKKHYGLSPLQVKKIAGAKRIKNQ